MEIEITPSQIAKEIGAVESAIKAIFSIPSLLEQASRRKHVKKILLQLRSIYFRRDGSIDLLRRFSNGESISLEEIEQHSSRWINDETEVHQSIAELRELADLSNLNLTIDELNFLSKIIHDKTLIRKWLTWFFQLDHNNTDIEKFRNDANEIVLAVEKLNKSIELVEQELGK